MYTIINLKSEVLIDRSQIANPYLRLLVTVLGREIAPGSAWVAVRKSVVLNSEMLARLIVRPIIAS